MDSLWVALIILIACSLVCLLGFLVGRSIGRDDRKPEIDELRGSLSRQCDTICRLNDEKDELTAGQQRLVIHAMNIKDDTRESILATAVHPSRNPTFGYEWRIGEHEGMAPTEEEARNAVIEWSRREVAKRKNATAQVVKESRQ